MATWEKFIAGAGEIGELAEARIIAPGVVLAGTLRADGSPRISPLDLVRDPRCVVHSIVTDRLGTEGDLKLYGRAWDVTDPDARERYCVALEAKIDWRPTGDFHLFALDIESAGYVVFGEGGQRTLTWRPA